MPTIKGVKSKKREKNIYDYYDPNLDLEYKVSGFSINIYDNVSKKRIRKTIHS